MKGQPDIIIVNHHEIYMYSEMCIDFQTPSNNYKITEAQLSWKSSITEIVINSSSQMITTLSSARKINTYRKSKSHVNTAFISLKQVNIIQ